MRGYLTALILSTCFLGFSQEMRIGILRSQTVKRVSFSYNNGTYNVYGDANHVGSIIANQSIEVTVIGGKLKLSYNGVDQGAFSIISVQGSGAMAVKSISPSVKERKYQNSFEITLRSGKITIVNQVPMENYLCGVLESEAGGGRHAEYYKVQALMSRTYALKNKVRHKEEGFNLCDGVHCQAYHNMLRFTPAIRIAVRETKGEVLVDKSKKIVTTYFSANCGGQICDASYVWNTSVPHVQSFLDTFCIHTKQSRWTKRVSQSAWKKFLVNQYGYPIHDSAMNAMIYDFTQNQRKAFYIHPSLGIPLRDLRTQFNLKSTFFSTHPEGTDVVIEGRGFGHGVGLCQEGAMNMAQDSYTYQQIALYYFTGLQIKKFAEL
ncbi:MAG: stage II sporulation protein D [Crocinitomicaceae bacterium]|jgi:stage II sporulation protein D